MTPDDTREELEIAVRSLDPEAQRKLMEWLKRMEPEDYDAPGSTVRESGV